MDHLISGAQPQFFTKGGGGADPGAEYNLCMISKIMVSKSFRKYNITLFSVAFVYIQITKCYMT